MSDSDNTPQLGCPACRAVPASRDALQLSRVRNLYEEPHEGYALYECRECHQPFLEQFQEITWLPNGEDDIWLRWLPLTSQERTQIDARFPNETEDAEAAHFLAKLMRERERLVRDPLGRFSWAKSDAGNRYGP